MGTTVRALGFTAAVAFLVALPAGAEPAGGFYKNERWGYKVRVPKDWTEAAMSAGEEWIASKHLSKRLLEPKNSKLWTREAPEMWVIGFPHARKEDRGAKVVEKDGELVPVFDNPYADYKDFVQRNRGFLTWEGGGYYFSKEEETEIGGVKVTQYEIKVEKMVSTPRRVVAWVWHFDDIDFAVQCKVLEDYWDSYDKSFEACLKSFGRIDRTAALPRAATTGGDRIVEEEDIRKLPPEERKKALSERAERKFLREDDALPKGWSSRRSEHYYVLSNADEKFVKRSLDHAETLRAYLDKTFGGAGGEYVPAAIIRIFASDGERMAYLQGTKNIWLDMEEVLIVQGAGWEKDWEYNVLNRGLLSQWVYYKNRLLAQNMPEWLAMGLYKHVEMIRTKGSSVDFTNENWDRDSLRLEIKKGSCLPIQKLIQGDAVAIDVQGDQDWQKRRMRDMQSGSFVHWLMTKAPAKYKKLLPEYLGYLLSAVEEAETQYQAQMDKIKQDAAAAANSESEDADDAADRRWEEIAKAIKEKRQSILDTAYQRAFGNWKASDWKSIDKAWAGFAG
ncbi:MAG: hypothetical protein ACREID_02020 [Planctomycetota bacterium]